jgi:miniconductance mechanosensitive channel
VFLGVLFELTNQKKEFRDRPLKGVYQIVQVGLFFVGTILIISILINKSPIHLFAGLGASAAILMLVFKDTIMGFVRNAMFFCPNYDS